MCSRIRRWKDGRFTLQLCKTKQQFSRRFRRRGPERGRKAQWKERKIAVNIVSQFISSVAAVRAGDSFADKVDEATIMLLMSTKLEVRKAAYSVQLTYHVEKKSRKINEQLRLAIRSICRSKVEGWYDNASWNVPSNNWRWSIAQVLHQDCRSSFDRLLLRIHDRKGKTEAVVSATCNITSSISFIPCPALCQANHFSSISKRFEAGNTQEGSSIPCSNPFTFHKPNLSIFSKNCRDFNKLNEGLHKFSSKDREVMRQSNYALHW